VNEKKVQHIIISKISQVIEALKQRTKHEQIIKVKYFFFVQILSLVYGKPNQFEV